MLDEESRRNIKEVEEQLGHPTGIGKIEREECPRGAAGPLACMVCSFGHMLECHYPYNCDEAQCSHYPEDEEPSPAERKLGHVLCCAADDHMVKDGGQHINLVQLKKLAKWPYLASMNVLIPESVKYPLANAVVCDRCLKEKREINYAMAGEPGENGKARYYRVPIDDLQDPEFYWPDHHPDWQ